MSGKPLGRPNKETSENKNELKAEKLRQRQHEVDRIPVEGKFGNCKRKVTLGRIMAKLTHTSESVIHVGIVVLNLDKWLAELLLRLFSALMRPLCLLERLAGNLVAQWQRENLCSLRA
jgi:hypothetical protein